MVEMMSQPSDPERQVTAEEIEQVRSELLDAVRLERLFGPVGYRLRTTPLRLLDLPEEAITDIAEQLEFFYTWKTMVIRQCSGMPAALPKPARLQWGVGTRASSPVPIDALGSLPNKERRQILDGDHGTLTVDRIIHRMEELTSSYGLLFDWMHPDDADQVLGEGATDAVVKRANLARSEQKAILSTHSGLNVTVHTQSFGLEVLYSPAYFKRYNQRFGGRLSTPVSSCVGPGMYVFGARLDSGPFLDDEMRYDIPPTTDIEMKI